MIANVRYETYNCAVNGTCAVAAPTAESLTEGHAAANRDRTKPGYGGQCTPDQYDDLESKKSQACSDAATKGGCKGDNKGGFIIDIDKANSWDKCSTARENVANICFLGGDDAHKDEIKKVQRAAEKCRTGK